VCGVYGQHWGGPEGDLFGRAAEQFEAMGVAALLINCLPPTHVDGMLPWLRDFTDLPLGAYPNLGYYSNSGWRQDERIGPAEYAELALSWRSQEARIVGGCCRTTPAHIAAVKQRLAGTKAGSRRGGPPGGADPLSRPPQTLARPWSDAAGRRLYPLPFPELELGPGEHGQAL
jgi:Homocysteine S-methyltransferase